MTEDSVLREVREVREAYAREHGFDLKAIFADLRERDARGDWKVVRLSPRPAVVVSPGMKDLGEKRHVETIGGG